MGLPADQVDGRTDLYALGGVLHEMLTGTTCLHSQTFDGWMYQHFQAERIAPSKKRPELANWPALDALVLSLLAKDRNHRPATAAELIHRFDEINQWRRASVSQKSAARTAQDFAFERVDAVPIGSSQPVAPAVGIKTIYEPAPKSISQPRKNMVWIALASIVFLLLTTWGIYMWHSTPQLQIARPATNDAQLPRIDTQKLPIVDTPRLYVVGEKGTILRSDDDGATWVKQISGTEANLYSVNFRTTKLGWASGDGSTIMRTVDGGKTWVTQNQKSDGVFNSVAFGTTNDGWAVGSDRKFHSIAWTTKNGGQVWDQETVEKQLAHENQTSYLQSIVFPTPLLGWIVGGYSPGSDFRPNILHTTDGGATWFEQTSGAKGLLNCVFFINLNSGWVAGDYGTILHTDNGGNTWIIQATAPTPTRNSLSAITFVTLDTGWAVGWKGTILHSGNGGKTWIKQDSNTQDWLQSAVFRSSQSGWIVGAKGTILHTNDGGATWHRQSSGTSVNLMNITVAEER